MREAVTFPQIQSILAILDERRITREKIEIPLSCDDPGGIEELPRGRIRVTVPASGDFDEWLAGIRDQILSTLGA